jgi:Transposase DDE domain
MEMQIIAIYFICDEITKQSGINDDAQSQMTTAEIMTSVIVAAELFGGNQKKACTFLRTYGHIPTMLSPSRFNRRMHAISDELWRTFSLTLSKIHQQNNPEQEFVVDSFPVAVCQNIRIRRSKIYKGEDFRGYIASKKQYFYGLKVHMLTSKQGGPVEFSLAAGSESDIKIFKEMSVDLPGGSKIYADKAYTDYGYEDIAFEAANIEVIAQRKDNAKRKISPAINYFLCATRKKIETAFSCITQLFPKTIHAVVAKGFEIKIIAFILAYSMNLLLSG